MKGFQFGVPGFEDIGKRKKPRSVSDTRAELSGCSKFDKIEHCYFDDRLILLLLDELTSRDPTRMRESELNPEHEGTLSVLH